MPNISPRISLISLILLLLLVGSGLVGIGASLLIGMAYALIIGNHYQLKTHWAANVILKTSIVLLGFAINFTEVFQTAKESFWLTVITILFAIILGVGLGRLFKVDKALSFLVACGTAICGGSAIAAIAPAIKARPTHVIVSISIVFLLNAAGLLLFPEIGQYLNLSQSDFGLWAALAIHDTSSVVGAATIYGEEALKVATTTKLARALWIVPLALAASTLFHNDRRTIKVPLFIILFVIASIISSFVAIPTQISGIVPAIAKTGMAISLFLIGSGFSRATLSEIQWSALWQGIILWILVSLFSLWLIMAF